MTYPTSRLALFGIVAGSLLLQIIPAQAAMDAKKVADAIVAAAAAGNEKASYAKSAASGPDVVITGFKSINAKGDTLDIPSIVVFAPSERPGGGFTATKLSFDNTKLQAKSSKDPSVALVTGSIETVVVPSAEEIKAKTRITPFLKAALSGMSLTGSDLKAPITIGTLNATLGNVTEGVPHELKMNVGNIAIPQTNITDPDFKAELAKLGYTAGFVASIAVDGTYVSETDTLTLSSLSFGAEKVGKLTIATTMSGVPLSKAVDASKASELLFTAALNTASIRFENDGLIEKWLDRDAKAANSDRKTAAGKIVADLKQSMGQIGLRAAFADKVVPAFSAFLDGPKSFSLLSAPGIPVPVMTLMGAAFSEPGNIADILKLDVKANQ